MSRQRQICQAAPDMPRKTGHLHIHQSRGCNSMMRGVRVVLWERDFESWVTEKALDIAKSRGWA